MNKLLVQLVLVISSIILISGCNSGGSLPAEEETDVFFGPLPKGLPVFVEIVEPYFNASKADESAIALYSYNPQDAVDSVNELPGNEIFSSNSNIVVSLNTLEDSDIEDSINRSEFTVLVRNDSVYLVNHLSNEIRLLNHFTTKVCEIIPTERVADSSIDPITGEPIIDPLTGEPITERDLTVLHKELIYVMTVETSDSCISGGKERFYELPLDHQLEVTANEDAELENLELVTESQARSKLIFGWVPDINVPDKDRLVYAYLGYDSEHKKLELFDEDKEIKWSQKRVLQQFDVTDLGSGMASKENLFHLEALGNYQYLVQLGLDVFVVDAGLDLINKEPGQSNQPSQIDSILTDKVVTLSSETTDSDLVYALPAVTKFNDENLFIIDDAKIYHLLYQTNVPPRNPSKTTTVVHQNSLSIDGKEHLQRQSFSQFDLKNCENDDFDCLAAHDVEAQTWQFVTPCEEQYGCDSSSEVSDYCETLDEKLQTQSNEPLCSASNWLHMSELNDQTNDATLLAYMQYAPYVQRSDFILHNERLYINAKMDQKDLFLSYDFKQDFSAPKLLREQVLFGKRASLVAMDPYFVSDKLFLTALQEGALRSNECYKNYQKVSCIPSEIIEVGSKGTCTGKDLAEGICTDQFREYESKAFFCSEDQLTDLTCSDANLSQLNSLAIEADDEDAKWLKLYDYETESDLMYLLTGDHAAALESKQLDEGKIYLPSLYRFDLDNGQKDPDAVVASLEGSIEHVVGGWLYKGSESADSLTVFGHINVISEEIKQNAGAKAISEGALTTYLLEQTFEDDLPVTKAPKVAERVFERPTVFLN